MTAAIDYYRQLSTVSFTLLGLWFIVLGLDFRWRGDLTRRRANLHTALCFFLPGMLGLGSVLGGASPVVWRALFVVGGAIGVAESVWYLLKPNPEAGPIWRLLTYAAPWVYLLVVVAAALPGPVVGLVPLQVEGIVSGLVFCIGMGHLWLRIADPEHSAEPGSTSTPRTDASGPAPPTQQMPGRNRAR